MNDTINQIQSYLTILQVGACMSVAAFILTVINSFMLIAIISRTNQKPFIPTKINADKNQNFPVW